MDNVLMPQVPVRPPKPSLLTILQYVFFISVILYAGKELFIPLGFAMFISFVFYPVCTRLEKMHFSRSMAIFIPISLFVIAVLSLIYLLIDQLAGFATEWPFLKQKLIETLERLSFYLSEHFNLSREEQLTWLKGVGKDSSGGALNLLKDTLYSSGVWGVLLVLVPIFSALILYYRSMLASVLYSIFPPEKKNLIRNILTQTVTTYYNFIKGMALVYLIVGVLNSVGLWIIGVPHAVLFGFIASVLTFIPYIGIIVASLFPITISWLTYNSILYPIMVIALFTFVQYLEANLIFPIAVSSRLQINTLVTIIMIVVGGILWGAAGMILFIPFIAIVKLVADNTEELHSLSRLLGTKNK
jgi:predicted PurR-regulated permease PerM